MNDLELTTPDTDTVAAEVEMEMIAQIMMEDGERERLQVDARTPLYNCMRCGVALQRAAEFCEECEQDFCDKAYSYGGGLREERDMYWQLVREWYTAHLHGPDSRYELYRPL